VGEKWEAVEQPDAPESCKDNEKIGKKGALRMRGP